MFTASHGSPPPAAHTAAPLSFLSGARVPDGLVHAQDETGGLSGGCDGVYLHHGRLPHECLVVVGYVFIQHVNTVPQTTYRKRITSNIVVQGS